MTSSFDVSMDHMVFIFRSPNYPSDTAWRHRRPARSI